MTVSHMVEYKEGARIVDRPLSLPCTLLRLQSVNRPKALLPWRSLMTFGSNVVWVLMYGVQNSCT